MESAAQLLSYTFMQNALAAILLASVACGIVGTLVVCNRLTFLAGGASHAAYGGIGLAFFFGLPVLPCTVLFTLTASLFMGRLVLEQTETGRAAAASADTGIGVLWAAGMAFGIILIQLTPGYAGELTAFLFGSLLSVPKADLLAMAGFDLALLAILFLCGPGLFLVSADPDFARSRGIPARGLTLLIIGLTAVAVVLLIRVAGLILVLALLTIPPMVARRVCSSFLGVMIGACIAALAFCLAGLYLSWILNLPPGAVIVGIATIAYLGLSPVWGKLARITAVCILALGLFLHPQTSEAAAGSTKTTTTVETKTTSSTENAATPQSKSTGTTKSLSSSKATASTKSTSSKSRTTSRSRKNEELASREAAVKGDLTARGISSGYDSVRRRHHHKGIDIPAPQGSPALAFLAGEVVFAGRYYAYGNLVRVRQVDGKEALYGHLQRMLVKVGDKIEAGQQIGAIGRTGRATGYHLHFELRDKNDQPIDPTPYFAHACEIVPDARLCPTPRVEAQAELNADRRKALEVAQKSDVTPESLAADAHKGPYYGNSGAFPSRLRWSGPTNTVLLP